MKISILGTGLMGYPMTERLLSCDHQVTVYNRTMSKAIPLKEKGADVVQSPHEAFLRSECVIMMLSDAHAIDNVLSSVDSELFNNKVLIQMGTISPSESISLKEKIEDKQGSYFECPVLGSRKEALTGKLILMTGATQDQYENWKELLSVFGKSIRLIGEVGKAAALKLALNQLIIAHAVSFSHSLGIVINNSVNVEDFAAILRESALYAPAFDKKMPRWVSHDYSSPNFPVKHMIKDIDLVLKVMKQDGQNIKAVESIRSLLCSASENGFGDLDYSAVFEAINPNNKNSID